MWYRNWSRYALSEIVASSHTWLASPWNVASANEKVNFSFCLILINLNFNWDSCMMLVSTLMDSSVLECKKRLECHFHESKDHLYRVSCCSLNISNCVWHIVSTQKILGAWVKPLEVRNRKSKVVICFTQWKKHTKISMTIREFENFQ